MNVKELENSIKDTKNIIKLLDKEKKELIESFEIYCKPSGYKTATSYIDADLIYAGSRENSLELLGKKIDRINSEIIRLEETLKFDEKGLIPAVVQDVETKEVLMLAYMNKESIKKTLNERKATYFSRSRNELWTKGETSGNTQDVKGFYYDCDKDTILLILFTKVQSKSK